MSLQPTLPGFAAAPVVGDELGRMYTPDDLADRCLDRVLDRCGVGPGHTVVEPSVGGGSFARAVRRRLPRARLVGVDLDPGAVGLDLVDVAAVADTVQWAARTEERPTLVLGNPDFGSATEHVEALLGLTPWRLALILPLDRIGRVGWHSLLYEEPVEGMRLREVHPITPRPWPEHVRETAMFVWGVVEPRCGRVFGDPIVWRRS